MVVKSSRDTVKCARFNNASGAAFVTIDQVEKAALFELEIRQILETGRQILFRTKHKHLMVPCENSILKTSWKF